MNGESATFLLNLDQLALSLRYLPRILTHDAFCLPFTSSFAFTHA